MSATTRPGPSLLDGLRRQLRVIGALTLREMGTRFGREGIGFLWLFGEPAMLGGAIGVLHQILGHGLPGDLPPVVFWVIGYVPYYLFRGVLNRSAVAIVSNQSLLYHRQITLDDILISRNLLEGAAVGGAMAVFLVLFGCFLGEWPAEPALIVIAMLLMLALTHGLAMMIAAGSVYTEWFERLVHLFTYLTLPAIGSFFMVFWLPLEVQKLALWVPTVSLFELVRAGQFGDRVPTSYDIPYVLAWAAVTNLLGLAALRRARRDLVV